MSEPRRIKIPITCDWSISAVNYMFQMGRENSFGPPQGVYCNDLAEGESFCEWGVVFEHGDIVYSEAA